jgi:hypothetical protein
MSLLLKGESCTQSLSFSLLLGYHEMNSFPLPCPSTMMFVPCHRPKNNGASRPWTETFETMKIKLSCFQLICSGISSQ